MTRSKCGQYPLFIDPRQMFKSYRLYLLNHFGKGGGGTTDFDFFFKFCVLRRYVFWIFTPSCLKTCIKPQPLFTWIPSQFKSLPITKRFVFPDNICIYVRGCFSYLRSFIFLQLSMHAKCITPKRSAPEIKMQIQGMSLLTLFTFWWP